MYKSARTETRPAIGKQVWVCTRYKPGSMITYVVLDPSWPCYGVACCSRYGPWDVPLRTHLPTYKIQGLFTYYVCIYIHYNLRCNVTRGTVTMFTLYRVQNSSTTKYIAYRKRYHNSLLQRTVKCAKRIPSHAFGLTPLMQYTRHGSTNDELWPCAHILGIFCRKIWVTLIAERTAAVTSVILV